MSNAGIWNGQTKTRPGAYIRFKAVRKANIASTAKGIVALPLALGWGADGVLTISGEEVADGTFTKKTACTIDDEAVQPLVEALKYASKALVYPLGTGGQKAKVVIGEGASAFTIEAHCSGTKGNFISVIIKETSVTGTFEVMTLLNNVSKDSQIAKNIEDLSSNDFVTFTGKGKLSANAGVSLAGGTDSAINAASFTGFLSAIKSKRWDVMALPLHGVDGRTVNAKTVTYIKELRDGGKKVMAVLNGCPDADCEGIISVDQGYKTDNEIVEVDAFTGTVAGLTAGAPINQSNTYRVITGATEIINPKTDEEIEAGLLNGCFMLSYSQDENVVIEQDINTLVNLSDDKNESFRKNRVIRVLDDIANTIRSNFENNYIGKVTRNEAGKNALKSSIIGYFTELQNMEAIQNFSSQDIEILDGENGDSVVVNASVQPLDSMEKLYMTVNVK